ncbi:MAG: hypothetical protein K0U98_11735 [Deltaproteobacteria bacterium]|nr:hypothetical protein [Deltaproteobacteria bacterium]
MSETYTKHLSGSSTEVVNNPVHTGNADLSSSHSATLKFKEIAASGDVVINVDHSATMIIEDLKCKNLTLNVSYASTLKIRKLTCSGTVKINVSYSSLFVVDGGAVEATVGVINYSSTGNFFAKIAKPDGVTAKNASTWQT